MIIIKTFVDCIPCLLDKVNSICDKYIEEDNKEQKYEVMKNILGIVANTDYSRTTPYLHAQIMRYLRDKLNIKDFYKDEKKYFNDKILSIENKIEQRVNSSEDKLLTALKLASAGNVIDFGAFSDITFDMVEEIIEKTMECKFDNKIVDRFKNELKEGKKVVYIADNAGEIVFDKICIKQILREYPHLEIISLVRGVPVLNDVTSEDAYYVGLDRYTRILENGSDIAGTDLKEISEQALNAIEEADVIISKGQGNYESLSDCGKNVYYVFLCKCDLLAKHLNCEKLINVFIGEI